MRRSAILAPTGSFDCLAAAIQAGADPVYFGVGQLNMRAKYIYISDFQMEHSRDKPYL